MKEQDFEYGKIHFYSGIVIPELNSKMGMGYWEIEILPSLIISGGYGNTFIEFRWIIFQLGIMIPKGIIKDSNKEEN
jgi:hypothetical protein